MSSCFSFESSSITLELSRSKVSVFNIYCPPSSSTFSKPFSIFSLNLILSFLSLPRLTNSSSSVTSTFILIIPWITSVTSLLSFYFLSSVNFSQHVNFPPTTETTFLSRKRVMEPEKHQKRLWPSQDSWLGHNLFWCFSGSITLFHPLLSIWSLPYFYQTVY